MNEHEEIMAAARRRSVERHEAALAEARASRSGTFAAMTADDAWEQRVYEFLMGRRRTDAGDWQLDGAELFSYTGGFVLGEHPLPEMPVVYTATVRLTKAPGVRAWWRRLKYVVLRQRFLPWWRGSDGW